MHISNEGKIGIGAGSLVGILLVLVKPEDPVWRVALLAFFAASLFLIFDGCEVTSETQSSLSILTEEKVVKTKKGIRVLLAGLTAIAMAVIFGVVTWPPRETSAPALVPVASEPSHPSSANHPITVPVPADTPPAAPSKGTPITMERMEQALKIDQQHKFDTVTNPQLSDMAGDAATSLRQFSVTWQSEESNEHLKIWDSAEGIRATSEIRKTARARWDVKQKELNVNFTPQARQFLAVADVYRLVMLKRALTERGDSSRDQEAAKLFDKDSNPSPVSLLAASTYIEELRKRLPKQPHPAP